MSIQVSKDAKFVYTVGVDHFLVKYRLWDFVSTLPLSAPFSVDLDTLNIDYFFIRVESRRITIT